MIVYRVFPFLATAGPTQPGHGSYVHTPTQGTGRLDNPRHYTMTYFGAVPECAVGESFGDLFEWSDPMFDTPFLPGGHRALGHYELPDDLNVVDLDDANSLLARGLRPTQVIARTRAVTQRWALEIFQEANFDGSRLWSGVRWWSFHRPQWQVLALWTPPGETAAYSLLSVDPLTINHNAVVDAAKTLNRPRVP